MYTIESDLKEGKNGEHTKGKRCHLCIHFKHQFLILL